MADRIGAAKSVVSYYELGARYLSYDVLVRIAHIIHTSTDYLLDISKDNVIGLSKGDIVIVRTVAEALKERNNN